MSITAMASTQNGQPTNQNTLTIDRIVSSQPELGPTPPDGGYGWVILVVSALTQAVLPNIISAYGVLVLYLHIWEEYEEGDIFKLWQINLIIVPVLATIFWLLFESMSRNIVLITNRPRIVSISGVLLICAGIMLSNFAVDTEGSSIIMQVFSGILIGCGISLTMQQSEILLKHFFRKKIQLVEVIYRASIIFGNVFVPLIVGMLCIKFEASTALILYSIITLQLCVFLLLFTRPTYIVKALNQNYNILRDAAEDEDETIYSSQTIANKRDQNENIRVQESNLETINIEDDQEEHTVGTFNAENTTREVVQPTSPVLLRFESTINPFGSNFAVDMDRIDRFEEQQPQALYRETTITNDVRTDHIFTFDPPQPNEGTIRRTAHTQKNIVIFLNILRDMKFYTYTFTIFCLKFSTLILGILLPSYVIQRQPGTTLHTVIMMMMLMYVGAACLTIIVSLFSLTISHKTVLRICSFGAVFALITLAESSTVSWLMVCGSMSIFSINCIHVVMKPIFNTTSTDFKHTAISTAANWITALLLILVLLVHDYDFATLFKVAACFHLLTPFLSFYME